MSDETPDTTTDAAPRTESDAEPWQTTRRTALRGAGLAGLLALGVGDASAQQGASGSTIHQAQGQTSTNPDSVPVTWANFPRANCHAAWQSTVNDGGFGQFYHYRTLSPIEKQFVPGANRDTLYSFGVFDLSEPVTITKPDTGERYQSMNVQNADQYVKLCVTEPGTYTITRDMVGTRYAGVVVRTFVDPTDPADVKQVRKLQDEIGVEQSSAGSFEIPNWDPHSLKQLDDALTTVVLTMDNYSGAYGDVGEVDPVKFFVASPSGWTGVPEPSQALILSRATAHNDGQTPYTLTVENVPVDGFWSVTVYNSDGYLEQNKYDAYSVNNVTAERNADGSVTIHFGGNPDQKNFLYTPEGWYYFIRLYQPREPIVDGRYQFPEAHPVQ